MAMSGTTHCISPILLDFHRSIGYPGGMEVSLQTGPMSETSTLDDGGKAIPKIGFGMGVSIRGPI